ncbi:GspE/PulE family protein [Propionicicella superfundia]|uniref:GspE/PulE family protein n=1 Tax=Propionicicella superfundia TaxID=348582 RepID=UPI00040EA22E|nr:ATPase, T2SS/T4P/T4SS family [Propionicicella superfundia]
MQGLVEALALTGAIDATTMSELLAEFGDTRDAGQHLLERRIITADQLAQAVAEQTGCEFFDLTSVDLDPAIIALVPGQVCRKYELIPIVRRPASQRPLPRRPMEALTDTAVDELVLGMVDPTDIIAIDDAASLTDLVIEPVVVSRDALRQAFERYVRSDDELSELSAALEDSAATSSAATETLEAGADDVPVVRFVNLLISQAVNDRASDIHIEPGEQFLTVRYRIDGVLHEMQRADRSIQDGVISRLKIMSQIDIAERRRPQDGRMSIRHEGRLVDLRVATLPTVWGEKIVMRILDNSADSMTMADLALSAGNRRPFEHAIASPHGMILVTGPTGSGKSTTLRTALSVVAKPEVNVLTIEDPVEFRIPGISQVQVNPKAGLTFHNALRAMLRCDPDVVLVGEIRDQETAVTSIEAALTGHLVLSTLHTNDAPSAVTRLVEIGAEPYLVATALRLAVAQRLARRLCIHCRKPVEVETESLDRLGFGELADPQFFRPGGCSTCSGTGYRGRIALHEVMVVTEEIEQLVVGHATGKGIRAVAEQQGMTSLRQDGWVKVAQGLTTIEEVLRVTV